MGRWAGRGIDSIARQWGLRRDPVAEAVLSEVKTWKGISVRYDAVHHEVSLGIPKDFTPGANKAEWSRFKQRFNKYRDRVASYVYARFWESKLGDHLPVTQLAHRLFPGTHIVSHKGVAR